MWRKTAQHHKVAREMPDNRETRHGLEGFPFLPLGFHHPVETSSTAQEEPLQKEKESVSGSLGQTPPTQLQRLSLLEGTCMHTHIHMCACTRTHTFTHSQLSTYLAMLGNNFPSSCREHTVIKNKENKGLRFARWLRFQMQTCKLLGKINLQITKEVLLLHLPLQDLTVPPTNSFIETDRRSQLSTSKSLGMSYSVSVF